MNNLPDKAMEIWNEGLWGRYPIEMFVNEDLATIDSMISQLVAKFLELDKIKDDGNYKTCKYFERDWTVFDDGY